MAMTKEELEKEIIRKRRDLDLFSKGYEDIVRQIIQDRDPDDTTESIGKFKQGWFSKALNAEQKKILQDLKNYDSGRRIEGSKKLVDTTKDELEKLENTLASLSSPTTVTSSSTPKPATTPVKTVVTATDDEDPAPVVPPKPAADLESGGAGAETKDKESKKLRKITNVWDTPIKAGNELETMGLRLAKFIALIGDITPFYHILFDRPKIVLGNLAKSVGKLFSSGALSFGATIAGIAFSPVIGALMLGNLAGYALGLTKNKLGPTWLMKLNDVIRGRVQKDFQEGAKGTFEGVVNLALLFMPGIVKRPIFSVGYALLGAMQSFIGLFGFKKMADAGANNLNSALQELKGLTMWSVFPGTAELIGKDGVENKASLLKQDNTTGMSESHYQQNAQSNREASAPSAANKSAAIENVVDSYWNKSKPLSPTLVTRAEAVVKDFEVDRYLKYIEHRNIIPSNTNFKVDINNEFKNKTSPLYKAFQDRDVKTFRNIINATAIPINDPSPTIGVTAPPTTKKAGGSLTSS